MPSVILRNVVNSIAGSADDMHGRPFLLGKAGRYGKRGLRMWFCQVRMPDRHDTPHWRSCLFTDAEVFYSTRDGGQQ